MFDRSLIRKVNQLVKTCTWGVFCEQILQHLGISKITHNQLPPQKSPILLISNHNSILDSLILGKLIDRKDYFFVALAAYSLLGPKIATQAIPIYRKLRLNHLIFEYPLSIISKRSINWLDTATIRAKNRASIAMAAEKLSEGGLVSIFPTGGVGKKLVGSHWKPGVGYMIKQISNPEVNVVFCTISGTQSNDILLFFHPVFRKITRKNQVLPSVHFSPPVKLSKLVDTSTSAKQIACELEACYQKYALSHL